MSDARGVASAAARREHGSPALRRGVAGSALILGLGTLLALLLDLHAGGAAVNATSGVVLLATTVSCVVTGRRHRGADRLWRIFIGLAALGGAGASVGSALAMASGGSPAGHFSPAQSVLLLLFAVALAGLLSVPSDPIGCRPSNADASRNSRLRWRAVTVLDCVLIVGSILLLGWTTMFGASIRAAAPDLAQLSIVAGTAVGSMTLTAAVVLIAAFRRPRSPTTLALLGTGLTIFSLAGSLFVYLTVHHQFDPPALTYLSFTVGDLLIFLSTLVPLRPPRPRDEFVPPPGSRGMWAHVVLPYAALATAGLLIGGRLLAGLSIDSVDIYGIVSLLLVALVRQMLTLAENTQLLSEIRGRELQLHYLAYHDPLTGLANRAFFTQQLQRVLDPSDDGGSPAPACVSLVFLDLDRFKRVNDTFGHAAGDELLRISARRLQAEIRADDTAARLGGDEFAVILAGDAPDAHAIGERLASAVQQPVLLAGQPFVPRASVGLVTFDPDSRRATPDVLLHQADQAMYTAKRSGTGGLVIYQPDLGTFTACRDPT